MSCHVFCRHCSVHTGPVITHTAVDSINRLHYTASLLPNLDRSPPPPRSAHSPLAPCRPLCHAPGPRSDLSTTLQAEAAGRPRNNEQHRDGRCVQGPGSHPPQAWRRLQGGRSRGPGPDFRWSCGPHGQESQKDVRPYTGRNGYVGRTAALAATFGLALGGPRQCIECVGSFQCRHQAPADRPRLRSTTSIYGANHS